MNFLRIMVLALILLVFSAVSAQYEGPETGFGIEVGGAYGDNSGNDESWSPRVKIDYQLKLAAPLFTQIGLSYTTLQGGTGYDKTKTVAGDVRFLLRPIKLNQMFPYFYAGAGAAKNVNINGSDFLPLIPVGLGIQTSLGEQLMFQISGGYNLVLSDDLDGVARSDTDLNRFTNKKHDGFFEIMVGLFYGNPGNNGKEEKVIIPPKVIIVDTDGDGINDDIELNKYKTDPNSADTDKDGLNDGDEILKYMTDPNSADMDSDGLKDGEEILKYKTDPKIADTDGDGLSDGKEVLTSLTDPLKKDTDGDGLSDGEEVTRYSSDPLKTDSDGDMLSDGDEAIKYITDPNKTDTDGDGINDYEEIMTYRTDPLKIDTDGGGMIDGAEIKAKKNPLDSTDDLFDLSKGKKIVLHGINFETNKSRILPESEVILRKVRESMAANPDATIIITGHTDNVGSDEYNRGLSQQRAQAVKDWLVKNNVSASRMKVIGKGETEPAATNDTKEGRAENRRIEFLVE
ncbi:MAG: OmpA family protein [Candidatus Cloacimonetes bacterium]|nr:OmpA family protein [Candidatus Cloacimonadota bacterium]